MGFVDKIERIASQYRRGFYDNDEYCIGLIEGMNKVVEIIQEELPMTELKDTVELMNSSDYKDRFKAEYWQTKIRYTKLHRMIIKYEAETLGFEPDCDIDLLKDQVNAMGNYLYLLELRAEIEHVGLFD